MFKKVQITLKYQFNPNTVSSVESLFQNKNFYISVWISFFILDLKLYIILRYETVCLPRGFGFDDT